MEQIIIISLLIAVIIGVAVIAFILLKKKPEKRDDSSLLLLQQQMSQLNQALDKKLSETNRSAQVQYSQNTKIVKDVIERLTKLDETNKQVVSFADQLKNLQDILKNPKQRGVLGEYYLETVLKNILPSGSFQMQYRFKNGEIVDAVVFVDKRIIPIDSKFSLENYNRIVESRGQDDKKRYEAAFVGDLKNRIDETAKYVRPEEKTTDFAFMFIPSEAVYYDLINNKVGAVVSDTESLITYAYKKKVMVVSANTFVAFLQTVLQGLRNQKISEEAHQIIKEMEKIGRHMYSYSEYMNRLGSHLDSTVSSYEKARKEFEKLDKDVVRITDNKSQIKIKEVERPLLDE